MRCFITLNVVYAKWTMLVSLIDTSFNASPNTPTQERASDVMTQTNKLEWRMILKISLRAKAGVPKTLVKQKLRLHSRYFPPNTLVLTESRVEFSDLHSIFGLRALRYWQAHEATTRSPTTSHCRKFHRPKKVRE